jgi:hypothetical protein
VFQFLFKPSSALVDAAEGKLQKVYNTTQPHPYTAWHWRSGGFQGEEQLDRSSNYKSYEADVSRLQTLISVLPCAAEVRVC